jgi:ABC-type antimicrobial peptide transport system ATPase subunit
MDDGRWVEMGLPAELLADPKEERTRKFLARIQRLLGGMVIPCRAYGCVSL